MPRRVRKRLLGEDIFITPDEFRQYAEATILFGTELAEAVAKK
jgi:hypothetical protein